MIVVELSCGLGNQMFQYAMGRRIAHFHSIPLVLDCTTLSQTQPSEKHPYKRPFNLDIFCLPKDIERKRSRGIWRILKKSGKFSRAMPWVCRRRYGLDFIEEQEGYVVEQPLIVSPPKNAYIRGFWQSASYFEDISDLLRQEFSFSSEVLPVSASLHQAIQDTASVCVHIRRGDYVGSGFEVLSLAYFLRAIETMRSLVKCPRFFVFCEDVAWCKNHLSLPDVDIVERLHDGVLNANSFQLMASCKHFIISNSTFSWWAAWLGNHPQKIVLSPNQWKRYPVPMDHIVPASWKKLAVEHEPRGREGTDASVMA